MKQLVQELISSALAQLPAGLLPDDLELPEPQIERTRDSKFGDFASNIAMVLAKPSRKNPRDLAKAIIAALPQSDLIQDTEMAGPGFINFRLTDRAFQTELATIIGNQEKYGHSTMGAGQKIMVEFVSANPTGPLHVGHGRLAAYGATVANLLEVTGHKVFREYYVNDAGRQMDILATSVWLRYLEQMGETVVFPSGGYKGQYIRDIADQLHQKFGDKLTRSISQIFEAVPADEPEGNKDQHIDGLINNSKSLLGENYRPVLRIALDSILDDIKDDLEQFGVTMDNYFSESQLTEQGTVNEAIQKLRNDSLVYEKEGAHWFKATALGDEKDRVVIRKNGQTTYIASDIAYHYDKRKRGFEVLLDVLGSDHHGYVARTRAALEAMGEPPESLEVRLIQFAVLYRGGKKVQMSTRGGEFVTLRELREEVGNDAARFFYVMRSNDQHLDFDLDLAKSNKEDNPVYYIGYAHARICSLLKKLPERDLRWDQSMGLDNLHLLGSSQERELLSTLSRYPEVVELSAKNRAPQNLVHFLRDLANEFHAYYWAHKILEDPQDEQRNARIALFVGTKQTIANGLGLLGVTAPEFM